MRSKMNPEKAELLQKFYKGETPQNDNAEKITSETPITENMSWVDMQKISAQYPANVTKTSLGNELLDKALDKAVRNILGGGSDESRRSIRQSVIAAIQKDRVTRNSSNLIIKYLRTADNRFLTECIECGFTNDLNWTYCESCGAGNNN